MTFGIQVATTKPIMKGSLLMRIKCSDGKLTVYMAIPEFMGQTSSYMFHTMSNKFQPSTVLLFKSCKVKM